MTLVCLLAAFFEVGAVGEVADLEAVSSSDGLGEIAHEAWAWAPPAVLATELLAPTSARERTPTRARTRHGDSSLATSCAEPPSVLGDQRANDRHHVASRRPLWRSPGRLRVDGGDEPG